LQYPKNITKKDIIKALKKINYKLKPMDYRSYLYGWRQVDSDT